MVRVHAIWASRLVVDASLGSEYEPNGVSLRPCTRRWLPLVFVFRGCVFSNSISNNRFWYTQLNQPAKQDEWNSLGRMDDGSRYVFFAAWTGFWQVL